jgi:glycosyltransferase involved in cell wall biosynthesis
VKVAFVLGTSAGGLGRHVRMLAAGCAARGETVAVFGPARTDRDFGFSVPCPPGSGAAAKDSPSAARPVTFAAVEIADRPRVLRDLRAISRLRRLLRSAAPDVVHAHGLRAGALSAIAIAFGRVPAALVVTVHNAPPAGGVTGAIYRVLELIVARNAASVLCVSPDLEDRMRTAGARRVAHAVVPAPLVTLTAPSPAPTPSAAPALPAIAPDVSAETRAEIRGEFGAGPVVLAVGRLAAQKEFAVLLDAAVRWRDLRPEPSLVIVGEGPLEEELKDRSASLGLAATFTGRRSDVPALLAAADVFVLPSAWEGQALILQEALHAGAPIVATRVGGNPDLLGEDAALLVPPGDPQSLADAVRSVLTDPALADRLRRAALDRARALPTENDAVAAALAEYRHVAPR